MDTPLPPQESFKPTNQITERRMPLKTKEEEVTPIRASTRGSLGSRAKVQTFRGEIIHLVSLG